MRDILSSILAQKSSRFSEAEKVVWLVSVMKWLQRPRSQDEKSAKKESVYTVRLRYLLMMLNKNQDWQDNFQQVLGELLYKISSPEQLAYSGFSSSGFLQEFLDRLQEKLLPQKPLSEDLSSLIYEIFPDEEESLFVDFIEPVVIEELLRLFVEREPLREKISTDLYRACYVLAIDLHHGLSSLRRELNVSTESLKALPEYRLLQQLQSLNESRLFTEPLFRLIDEVDAEHDTLYGLMSKRGVRIELVHSFAAQKRKIRRLLILSRFLSPTVSVATNIRMFLAQLIIDTHHQKNFKYFIADNLKLLTERIVQNNSHIGEHYVATTWEEFRSMFKSAVGGGAITALTVFVKIKSLQLGLTGFLKGVLESLNYSSSFLLIQLMGWTLATKQPSSTAPFMAKALAQSTTTARQVIVALLRTQFIAVLGNLSMVFPLCFTVSYALWAGGYAVVDRREALEIINSTNILGPSVLFAVFTGCLLFSSSLIAGWFENWFVLNQLHIRIQHSSFFRHWFGVARVERFAMFTRENANSLAANISLGFLLGLLPQVLKFFALPLDVRHVTLATGSFATALPVVLAELDMFSIWNAILGILVIGILNISVSFFLAFLLASTASQVRLKSLIRLLYLGFKSIVFKPWLLLLPEDKKVEKSK